MDFVELQGNRIGWDCWAKKGWKPVCSSCILPTFTRAIPRERPPYKPAGLSTSSAAALERWKCHGFRYPPYTYEEKFMMTNGSTMRPVSASEREVILGFSPGYTRLALPPREAKVKTEDYEDIRCSLLGNTFSIQVVAWLLGQLLAQTGFLPSLPTPQDVIDYCSPLEAARISMDANAELVLSSLQGGPALSEPPLTYDALDEGPVEGSRAAKTLIFRLSRGSSYKGNDIRILPGGLLDTTSFPRRAFPSKWWRWRTVISFRFRHAFGKEHINVLELRAALSAFKWRARKSKNLGTRFLHLLDSQVNLGAIGKGRSNSRGLASVLEQVSAVLLAADFHPFGAYIRTDDNPADAPSRQAR